MQQSDWELPSLRRRKSGRISSQRFAIDWRSRRLLTVAAQGLAQAWDALKAAREHLRLRQPALHCAAPA